MPNLCAFFSKPARPGGNFGSSHRGGTTIAKSTKAAGPRATPYQFRAAKGGGAVPIDAGLCRASRRGHGDRQAVGGSRCPRIRSCGERHRGDGRGTDRARQMLMTAEVRKTCTELKE